MKKDKLKKEIEFELSIENTKPEPPKKRRPRKIRQMTIGDFIGMDLDDVPEWIPPEVRGEYKRLLKERKRRIRQNRPTDDIDEKLSLLEDKYY